MQVEILRAFTCSREGGSVDLKPGDAFDIPDRLGDRLAAAGYVRAVEPAIPPSKPENRTDDPPGDDDAQVQAGDLSVRHIGRGRWAVFRGEDRLTNDAMTKDAAIATMAGMA